MAGQDGYITPPPGLLPPPPESEGVPQREYVPAVPGGLPFFAPTTPAPDSAPVQQGQQVEHAQQVQRPASVPAPTWSLVLADGSSVRLSGATFVGRNPAVTDAAPEAGLLPLVDPSKSLSKTHALLVPQLDYLMVTDLHSTNGIAVIMPDGAATVLEPGRTSPVASGSQLQLGSFVVTVRASAG